MHHNYPQTVIELIDHEMYFQPAVLQALRDFASSKPWSESLEKRKEKFIRVNHDLSIACNIPKPELLFGCINGSSSGKSYYQSNNHRIVLTGKMSVVTFLHEFAHAMGKNETNACRWSINLFRICFPRQFSRLVHRGHMLFLPSQVDLEMTNAR